MEVTIPDTKDRWKLILKTGKYERTLDLDGHRLWPSIIVDFFRTRIGHHGIQRAFRLYHRNVFDTPFYKSTLAVRAQLVSDAINPDNIFPWIKEEKEALSLTHKSIYLLTGEDDVVVGKDGTERLKDQLEAQGNVVVLEKPAKLAHHLPENAAPHIKKWLKDQGFFN